MSLLRRVLLPAFAAALLLGAGARAVRADDQTTIISAHGDALANATSAPALVRPMPALPPNSAPPAVPETAQAGPVGGAPGPSVAPSAVSGTAPSPQALALPSSQPQAVAGAAPAAGAPPAAPGPGSSGRMKLIVAGALIALAMFLWERRSKS